MPRIFNPYIELPPCQKCDGSQFIKDEYGSIVQIKGFDQRCSCFYDNKFLDANIGFDYWKVTKENFQGEIDDLNKITNYFDKILKLKEQNRGFYIYGPNYGVGKTSLANIFLKEVLMTTNFSGLFVPFSDLVILNIKYVSGFSDKIVEQKLEIIKNIDFLVLDDLAKEYDNNKDYGRATLNSILRFRDLWHKPTIYTSNVPIGDVEALYGSSNYSLIFGRSDIIEVTNAEDFRRTRKIQQNIKDKKENK